MTELPNNPPPVLDKTFSSIAEALCRPYPGCSVEWSWFYEFSQVLLRLSAIDGREFQDMGEIYIMHDGKKVETLKVFIETKKEANG